MWLPQLIAALLLPLCSAHRGERGMLCNKHPLYTSGFKSAIIRSWNFRSRPNHNDWWQSFYLPRYEGHIYAPEGELDCHKYSKLDMFVTHSSRATVPDFARLHFQRPAKVFLLVAGWAHKKGKVTLTGWHSEGWARLVKGRNRVGRFGVSKQVDWHFPHQGYIFSKTLTGNEVDIPSVKWMRKHAKGIHVGWSITVLIGESNGSPPSPPSDPLNLNVTQGGRCPDELHDAWKVLGQDRNDPLTNGTYFKTYHPLWDPCYWCAYDHDHGSDPYTIMGYRPRFGYCALKNYLQDESHKGFKGIVMRNGDLYVYFQLHAHLSGHTRFTTRFHTVVIVITHAITQEVLAELHYKADYGFTSTRNTRGRLIAASAADRAMQKAQQRRRVFASRQMNFIDPTRPDKRFQYSRPILRGKNEHWFTEPMCSVTGARAVKVEFRNPATALRVVGSTKRDDLVRLGNVEKKNRKDKGRFVQHASNVRDLDTRYWKLSDRLCRFELPNIRGSVRNGVFYTDPFGNILLNGPHEFTIRQYIKPGFNMTLRGTYKPSDTWVGVHEKGFQGHIRNVGFAIDPSQN